MKHNVKCIFHVSNATIFMCRIRNDESKMKMSLNMKIKSSTRKVESWWYGEENK